MVVYKLGFDSLERLLNCFLLDTDQSIIDLVAQQRILTWISSRISRTIVKSAFVAIAYVLPGTPWSPALLSMKPG